MLIPNIDSCIAVRLPGALCPCVLRVCGVVGFGSSFRLRCSLVSAGGQSCLGRWSGKGFVLVPVSAVRRVLPQKPFGSRPSRQPLCKRVPAFVVH